LTHEAQLAWEKRFGVIAAVAAFGSALAGAAALAVGASLQSKSHVNDIVEELVSEHNNPGQYTALIVLQGVSIALLAVVLVYLYRATRYRRPEIQSALLPLAAILPALVGVLTIVAGLEHLAAADRVFPKLPLSPDVATKLAEHETLHGTAATVGYVAAAAGLALAFTIGMISIQARRAGLLSGFMGILGAIVGALIVLGSFLGMPPIVQYFWVTALGLLFLNRWPGQQGRGPAWDSGEAEPWPTAAELRAAQQGAGAGGGGGGGGGGRGPARPPARREQSRARTREAVEEPEYESDEGYDDEPEPAGTPHPRSKKRKRKRRR
jgi:hypothetical protein